jgi:hypothetical protein
MNRGCKNCKLVIDAAETYRPGWTKDKKEYKSKEYKSISKDTNFDAVLKLHEDTDTGTITA